MTNTMPLKTSFKRLATSVLALSTRHVETLPILAGSSRGFRVPRALALFDPRILLGRYEPGATLAILGIERPLRVAYDVGAHVGLLSLVLVKKIQPDGRVVAFEPCSENLASLRDLIAANSLPNVTAVGVALADRNGEQKFIKGASSFTGQIEQAGEDGGKDGPVSEVIQTATLDSLVFERGFPAPDFIKIDVEGAEALVLMGGQRVISEFKPVLLIELHGPTHAAAVWDVLPRGVYQWNHIGATSGLGEAISQRTQLLAYFGPGDRWTQQVLLR